MESLNLFRPRVYTSHVNGGVVGFEGRDVKGKERSSKSDSILRSVFFFQENEFLANESQTAFISYSREDSEFVLRLAGDLKAAGAAVWLDQLDIATGKAWDVAIERALIDCPRLMVVLSPAAVASPNVQDEVSFALQKWKAVVPVLYRDCEIPYRLHRLQHVDFRKDYAWGLKELVEALTDTRTLTPGPRLGHWRRQVSEVSESDLSVAFPTQELGWAAGSYGLMLHTEDGGSTWTQREKRG
jgi:hypothetical protein